MDIVSSDKSNPDGDLYLPQTDSFWEIGKYSRVVKRCDDGHKLTTDLISMINERAEIEKTFSKMLKSWSKKWSDYVIKSSEFGSMVTGWKALMYEADATAEVHQAIHDDLENDVVPGIKSWQKSKYIKAMLNIKSTKEFEEDFKRAQKPWAKLYTKVEKYKREYHTTTKNLKTAETQENNTNQDNTVQQEQRNKIIERVQRLRKEKQIANGKYAEALQELNRYNPKYMDDMNDVFGRCQLFEKDRLVKFQEFLSQTEKCLEISNRLKPTLYEQFRQTIKNCDAEKDLSSWSDNYGATMKMNWPVFEEYSESYRSLGRRGKGELERENPVVVTAIRSNGNGPPNYPLSTDNRTSIFPANQSPVPQTHSSVYPPLDTNTTSNSNPFGDDDDDNDTSLKEKSTFNRSNSSGYPSVTSYSTHDIHAPYPAASNPFLDDDDNVDSTSPSQKRSSQSITSPGSSSNENNAVVRVRALYDYDAQEQDELSFKQGEIFTKLEDEDDQGWCKGRVGNRVGLYPATYVDVL